MFRCKYYVRRCVDAICSLWLWAFSIDRNTGETSEMEAAGRWGVLIEGHDIDISNWIRVFVEPFDPFVTQTEHGPALWSENFNDASSALEVLELSRTLLDVLNSIVINTIGGEPVVLDGVVLETARGEYVKTHVLQPMDVESRSSVSHATLTVHGESGSAVKKDPLPSRQQNWAAQSVASSHLSDLLIYSRRDNSWIDIYKAVEVLEEIYGGERKLLKRVPVDPADIKALKHNANYYHRHARGKFDPPKRKMSLSEARSVLRVLTLKAFEEAKM